MESYHKKYHRIGRRYGLVLGIFLFVCLLFVIAWLFGNKLRSQIFRQAVVIMDDQVYVWSFSTKDNASVLISIPKDTVIDAVNGFGRYSLTSLWQLGALDKKKHSLLSQSLQETLGIPIAYYIGPKSSNLSINTKSSGEIIQRYFTFKSLPLFFTGNYNKNINIFKYVALIIKAKNIARQNLTQINLSESQSLFSEILPDGTSQMALDSTGFEKLFGHAFEDEKIREEHLSIAIYNTTEIPMLGQKAARLLNHLGMLVVTVGNDTPSIDSCQLIGSPASLKSKTAKFILDFYNCRLQAKNEKDRTDLTLKLGTVYASLFLPDK